MSRIETAGKKIQTTSIQRVYRIIKAIGKCICGEYCNCFIFNFSVKNNENVKWEYTVTADWKWYCVPKSPCNYTNIHFSLCFTCIPMVFLVIKVLVKLCALIPGYGRHTHEHAYTVEVLMIIFDFIAVSVVSFLMGNRLNFTTAQKLLYDIWHSI